MAHSTEANAKRSNGGLQLRKKSNSASFPGPSVPSVSESCAPPSSLFDLRDKSGRIFESKPASRDTYPQLLGIVEQRWLARS